MTATRFVRSNLLPSAGLIVPPLLWAANTQAGQILPYTECGGAKYGAIVSFAAAILSLAAAQLSWWPIRRRVSKASLQATAFPQSFGFVCGLGGLNGLLFAFALMLQGASSLVLTGCER